MASVRTAAPITSIDRLVRELYGAVAEDFGLERCLDVLAPVFGSHVSGLHTENFGGARSSLLIRGTLSAREFASLTREYAERWSGGNAWIERSIPGYLHRGFESTDDVMSNEELVASPYYQHYLKQFDVRHGLGICLWTDRRDSYVVAAFNRSSVAGPITTAEKRLAGALQPHLLNLYAIYRKLARLQEAVGPLRACLDSLSIGMLVLDAQGAVVISNAKADDLLTNSSVLCIAKGGIFSTKEKNASKRLSAAIARSASADGIPKSQAIAFGDPSSREACVVHLCPVPTAAQHTFARNGRVLAFVSELPVRCEAGTACAILRGALGLTPTQARVAWLLRERRSPDQIASSLGTSISTVRTHLKHLFRTTSTQKQSELVQLVENLIATAPCDSISWQ